MSAPRAITCPACGGTVEVRAAGFSVNLGCIHCGSILDVSRPEVALIERHAQAARSYELPLGARGSLFGDDWQVVGATMRADSWASWQEFLLFNPYRGYRWLVLAEGDWQFGTPLVDRPQWDGDRVVWRDRGFAAADPAAVAEVKAVAGEFYWRLAAGDTAECTLFESGDEVLSRECSADEENWTHLVPLPAATVVAAFGLETAEPALRRQPQGLMQPGGPAGEQRGRNDDVGRMLLIATITVIVALFAMVLLAGPVSLASGSVAVPVGGRTEPVRIGTISVTRPYQFVTITAAADSLQNRWVDLDYSLVDRATQQSTDAYGLVEFYTGTDSDGAWSEGSRTTETTIGRVPRGTYDVYVGAEAHGWPNNPPPSDGWAGAEAETITLMLDARTGAMAWGMWWTLVFALFTWPGVILWWRHKDDD